jgi:valyl-tRNA synthetase
LLTVTLLHYTGLVNLTITKINLIFHVIMPLSPSYKPTEYESTIFQNWQANKLGNPERQVQTQGAIEKAYANIMPPPNLTGDLHAGHAFGHYLMDTLTRIHRQKGEKSLWIPGVDHAGIQLEGVIDKAIKAGEFDEDLKNITGLPEDKEVRPKFLKKNHSDLWLKLAWKKANEWRDNQARQSSILGDTPDHSRNLFTLDEQAVNTVNYAFKKYYEDGLVYKKSYLINWSVGLQTALSDVPEDIGYDKRKDPFITFEYANTTIVKQDFDDFFNLSQYKSLQLQTKYFNENTLNLFIEELEKKIKFQVSTVRHETIFVDEAVAVHPTVFRDMIKSVWNDYFIKLDGISNKSLAKNIVKIKQHIPNLFIEAIEKKILELKVQIPLTNKYIPIILADEVDPNFGTGALKITPAHDITDYNIFHKYIGGEFEQAVGRDGKLTEVCGEFAGLNVEDGRRAVVKKLIENGYIPEKSEFVADPKTDKQIASYLGIDEKLTEGWSKYQIDWNYEHNVTICERSKTVVEPLISEEFFLSYSNKDSRGKSLQEYGLEGIGETNYFPNSFQKLGLDYIENIKDWCISRDLIWGHKMPIWYNLDRNPEKKFYTVREVKDNPELNQDFQIDQCMPEKKGNWVQEEKILDTWFSSCLWPLSTLNYIGHLNGELTDFDNYYPTQDMVTAREIFYAWIVRMTMLGKYFTNKIPFENVIITPTIQDDQGKKMSKSLKNGLEPVQAISNYSSDSLRMAMLGGMIPNRNMRLGGALADRLMEKYRNFGNKVWNVARFLESKEAQKKQLSQLSSGSVWILEKYVKLQNELEINLKTYELTHSINAIYSFLWDDFADWYVEYLKTDETQLAFAYKLFRQFIITLSPYLPFETQALWQDYFGQKNLLAFEKISLDWHTKFPSTASSDQFQNIIEFITDVRSVKGLYAIDPVIFVDLFTTNTLYDSYKDFIKLMARGNILTKSEISGQFVNTKFGYSINILEYIKDKEFELNRTKKLIESLQKQISQLETQLSNQKFIDNAEPEAILQKKSDLQARNFELEAQVSKLNIL